MDSLSLQVRKFINPFLPELFFLPDSAHFLVIVPGDGPLQ